MFQIRKQKTKIVNVNPRSELHGHDTSLACDIKLEVNMSNDELAAFDSALKGFLYKEDDFQDELFEEGGLLKKLRFPNLGPLKWEAELVGYNATIAYGLGDSSDIQLADVRVKNFILHAKEGGTVVVICTMQTHPQTEDVGPLCQFIQNEVEVTLAPPVDPEQYELREQQERARRALDEHFSPDPDDDGQDPQDPNPGINEIEDSNLEAE